MVLHDVSSANQIAGGAGQTNLLAIMQPVSLKIFKRHPRRAAMSKWAGEGVSFAIHLMRLELLELEPFRADQALEH